MRLVRAAAAALFLAILAAGPATAGNVVFADLALTKVGSPSLPAGTNVTYTLTVQNNGPSTATSVTLSDPLPPAMTFVSFTGPLTWTLTVPAVGSNGTVTATIPTLTVAAGVQTLTLVAHLDAGTTPGSFVTNTATVGGTTTDPTPANNSAVQTSDITAAPPPTPAASNLPNAAMPEPTTGSPIALLGLGALLVSTLATTAWMSRRRYRSE